MPTMNKTNIEKDVKSKNEKDLKIEELERKNSELESKLNQLIDLMMSKNKEETTAKEPIVETNSFTEYDEPSPNKQIRIMSLCYGSLNLAENKGDKARLKFSKYGEIRPCLYSVLMNIVNNNRSFAEKGYFYILDKSAIYHLGLEEEYKHIFNNDAIANICNYSIAEIKDILSVMNDEQKQTTVRLLCDKMFNNENIDYNKTEAISKYSGIDIKSKVDEMKRISDKANK